MTDWSEDEIRREGLPPDVMALLHDLAWAIPRYGLENYRERARVVLSAKTTPRNWKARFAAALSAAALRRWQ